MKFHLIKMLHDLDLLMAYLDELQACTHDTLCASDR